MTTGAATRVFLARLAGIGVFDPNGDQVGKVRDAIVVLRIGGNPPRLTGLVVEVAPRRRIFVPMTKVTAIDAGQVIVTGTVSQFGIVRFRRSVSADTIASTKMPQRSRSGIMSINANPPSAGACASPFVPDTSAR